MENIVKFSNVFGRNRKRKKFGFGRRKQKGVCQSLSSTLANANINEEYIIKAIETKNDGMKDFLFTLGCYEGQVITVISIISEQYIIVIKDARYSIDKNLASCITI